MNNIGEEINRGSAACREIYMPDLQALLHSNMMKFWSWGSHAFRVETRRKAVVMFRMTVSGHHHHKGHVYIFLNGLDLFDVYLTTFKGKIKDRTDEMGLYADQLVDWIDEKVEKIPEYKS
jgi:hypothetical protein